jgi:histone deacetylase 11
VPEREFLQEVMTWQYLFVLNYSIKVCKIVELPVCFLPAWTLRMRLLEPMACASLGSVEAAVIAKHRGWAINLGGGFHHARRDNG